jgi:hypothetical protein
MRRNPGRLMMGVLVAGAAVGSLPVIGADNAPPPPPTLAPLHEAPAATQPATQPSSEQVIQDLMSHRQPNPLIEPTRRPPVESVTPPNEAIDPTVLGTAPSPGQPGAKIAALHREGEFVVSRRGRLIHAAGHELLAFEGDGAQSPEPPMVLLPSQMLQTMEDLTRERGDKVVFIVSGEIFLYRGANYLLLTMQKMAIDQGNLKH